ncbi:MAG: peroxidase family protein, partial [Acidimicrobiales bacterium]
ALPAVDVPPVGAPGPRHVTSRAPDGSYNDLESPAMGRAGSRFGRNIPLDSIVDATDDEVLTPSPREVSRALMTRTEFVPATSVNSLVAAWLQFMIRDWFSHGTSPVDNPWVVPLAADDPWPESPMTIMRTPEDPTRPPDARGMPQTRVNVLTHWWDGSQVYGTGADEQRALRSGTDGKLRVRDDGQLPLPTDPDHDPSREPGFWVGLLMLQTVFALEHNAICDHLHAAYPSWDDDELFERARLVNAALIAKIHTVEWTPAVISHPTTKAALRANWFGIAGERIHRLFGRLSPSEVISGIPGGETDHYGVPYSLTEEFVAVYRMHPLLRDDWPLRSVADDAVLRECTFRNLAGPHALDVVDKVSLTDLFYSFGTLPPGLVTLYNFPRFLQEFERPDGHLQDLAATDILRTRELGVPRYNEFRRLLHLEPAADFETMTDNPGWAAEMR